LKILYKKGILNYGLRTDSLYFVSDYFWSRRHISGYYALAENKGRGMDADNSRHYCLVCGNCVFCPEYFWSKRFAAGIAHTADGKNGFFYSRFRGNDCQTKQTKLGREK
jgi:hypothetical protein